MGADYPSQALAQDKPSIKWASSTYAAKPITVNFGQFLQLGAYFAPVISQDL